MLSIPSLEMIRDYIKVCVGFFRNTMDRCPLLFSNTVRTEITRLVNDKKMLIGAFHAYGHGAKCQLLNISRHEGAGLTSGEEAEQVNAMLIPSSASLRKQS